ncbi:MAG: hypothetical protein JFAIHJKO_02456 [Pyrinomonadaceae bacterium]|nr:hypothetical protein [Pyrinomonadaceae bacterium]
MKKVIALSAVLALGALGMACGEAATNTAANKAVANAMNTANAAMANAANAMANAANAMANAANHAANAAGTAANSVANAAKDVKPAANAPANANAKEEKK